WSAHSGIIAASNVILARYVAYFIPLDDTGIRAVAIAAILLFSFVNYLGVRQGSTLQTVVTISKVAAILLLLGMAAILATPATHPLAAPTPPPPAPFREFALAVSAALFTFGGWHMVTYTAGETRDPTRTIPRALLISALVILSATGVLNGVILAGPRTYYAMAREGLAFRWLASLRHAIVLQAVWSCILVATGTYRALFTRVIYTEWLFFALMASGLMRLRGRLA